MYRYIYFLIILFLIAFKYADAQSSRSADSLLFNVIRLYDEGDYILAELESRRALENAFLSDSMRIELEVIIASSLIAQGKTYAAIEHFEYVLSIDNGYELNPDFTSPKILDVFAQAKKRHGVNKKSESSTLIETRLIEKPSVSYRVLFFPGWEQLHQGRTTSGYLFMSAGIITSGLAIYYDFRRSEHKKSYYSSRTPSSAVASYKLYNNAYKAEVYSACAFLAIYMYSKIDAFLFLPVVKFSQISSQLTGNSLQISYNLPIN